MWRTWTGSRAREPRSAQQAEPTWRRQWTGRQTQRQGLVHPTCGAEAVSERVQIRRVGVLEGCGMDMRARSGSTTPRSTTYLDTDGTPSGHLKTQPPPHDDDDLPFCMAYRPLRGTAAEAVLVRGLAKPGDEEVQCSEVPQAVARQRVQSASTT